MVVSRTLGWMKCELTNWFALLSTKVLLVNRDCLGKVVKKGALQYVWIHVNHGGEAQGPLNGPAKRGDLDVGDENDGLNRRKEPQCVGRLAPQSEAELGLSLVEEDELSFLQPLVLLGD